jgi:hypothetical protein
MATIQVTTTTGNKFILEEGPFNPNTTPPTNPGGTVWANDPGEPYLLGKGAAAEPVRLEKIWGFPARPQEGKPARVICQFYSSAPALGVTPKGRFWVEMTKADSAQIEEVTGLEVAARFFGVTETTP